MSKLDNLEVELADLDLSQLDNNDVTPIVDNIESTASNNSMQFFKHIPVDVTVEVAQKKVPLSELMGIGTDAIIMLDKQEGEPVDIKVNGKLFGQGEIVEQDNKYGVRIIHVIDPFDE